MRNLEINKHLPAAKKDSWSFLEPRPVFILSGAVFQAERFRLLKFPGVILTVNNELFPIPL
jgi:hypothetical protein